MNREMKIDSLASALSEAEKVLLIEALRYYAKNPVRPSAAITRRIKALQSLLSEAI
jgi:hypothetical protein